MTIEVQKDGFFYPYAVPIADAYMSSVPKTSTVVWLRASDEESLTIGEDLKISSWIDVLSGGGVNYRNLTIRNQPFLKRNSINGKSSILFDSYSSGSEKRLTDITDYTQSNLSTGVIIHLFIVFKVSLSFMLSTTQTIFGNFSTSLTGSCKFGIRPRPINTPLKLGFAKGNTETASAMDSLNDISENQWVIAEWQIKGNQPDSFLFINGQQQASKTLQRQGVDSSQFFIGNIGSAAADFVGVEIAEIICMNQIMPDPTPVRNYLSLRYNIPLVFP